METLFTNKRFIKVTTVLAVLLCLLTLSALFHSAGRKGNKENQNIITVTGHGEVKAIPDIATFSLSIRAEAKTVKEADAKVAVIEKKVLDFLKTSNILEKDIKTESVSFNPKYESKNIAPCTQYGCTSSNPIIVGYESYENITVKVRNTDDAGAIKQGLGALGVENLYGPNFAIDDEDTLKADARKQAIDDAREKAKILSRDLGVRLGHITSFNESGNYPMPMMYAKAMDGAGVESAPASLPKGENTISSDVTITYEIR
ncbi:MAG: SIMPL domain-containing protein [Patescibacteria group bacterium]